MGEFLIIAIVAVSALGVLIYLLFGTIRAGLASH